jgi:hypothetical protein
MRATSDRGNTDGTISNPDVFCDFTLGHLALLIALRPGKTVHGSLFEDVVHPQVRRHFRETWIDGPEAQAADEG